MGRKGWESIIPFYSTYVLFEELYGNGWKFLLLLVPIFNIYVIVKVLIDLAHKFNQSTAFGWGLVLLFPAFMCIMAFSNDIQCDNGIEVNAFDDVSSFLHNNNSSADELIKYKQLYDDGGISKEEYEQKKDELLRK